MNYIEYLEDMVALLEENSQIFADMCDAIPGTCGIDLIQLSNLNDRIIVNTYNRLLLEARRNLHNSGIEN